MNRLYWSKSESAINDREALFRKAMFYFLKDSGRKGNLRDIIRNTELLHDEKGRPYLSNMDVELSISHSSSIWMVLLSDNLCGVDVQFRKKANMKSIGSKYFSEREQSYIDMEGESGFYDIWCLREAYGKMTGIGFHSNPPDFVGEDMRINPVIYHAGNTYTAEFHSIFEGYSCASVTVGSMDSSILLDELEDPEYLWAYNQASRKLGRGNVSTLELRLYLRKNGYSDAVSDRICEEFKSLGYLDDVLYGELYFRYAESKGWAKPRIVRELKKKGLSEIEIEEAFSKYLGEEDEMPDWEKALSIIEKIADKDDLDERGRLNERIKGRAVRRLYGYGYSTDSILRAISEFEKSVRCAFVNDVTPKTKK